MKLQACRSSNYAGHAGHGAILALSILVLLLAVAGCVISPRRIVNESPSPTPTPNISPTPTPTPGITPTPTPTPAAATVPRATAQFLFLGDAASPLITGFRINSDGSLAVLPGSPFPASGPARSLKSFQDVLMVGTESGSSAYQVNKETGALEPMDLSDARLSAPGLAQPATGPHTAVLDASGNFMYVVDSTRAELLAFPVDNGKARALATAVYPVPADTSSIALVRP